MHNHCASWVMLQLMCVCQMSLQPKTLDQKSLGQKTLLVHCFSLLLEDAALQVCAHSREYTVLYPKNQCQRWRDFEKDARQW